MGETILRDHAALQNLDTGVFPVLDSGLWSYQSGLEQFSPLSLEQLGKAALMDRMETKYIFHRDQVLNILPDLEKKYQILEIKRQRIFSYRTVYYDTADFLFFQQHHNGSGRRCKIRQRTYLDTQTNFLEVKHKDNRKRTSKHRVQADFGPDPLLEREVSFLEANAPCHRSELNPKLEVWYTRTTLVRKDGRERVTLDSQLYYSNGKTSSELDRLMIAEVKQASYDPTSPFMAHLKNGGVHPSPFSKYCIGISLVYPAVKHNRFKPILRQVSKLLGGDQTNERTQ